MTDYTELLRVIRHQRSLGRVEDSLSTIIVVLEALIAEKVGIASNPTTGRKKITNIYWDSDTKEIVVDHE